MLWQGSSEGLALGASERLGASEWQGASERTSATRFLGASEQTKTGERWATRPGEGG